MNEWIYFEPIQLEVYSINTFDDGNIRFTKYPNSWLLYGEWLGKVALVNKVYPSVRITSISKWKLI